MNQLPEVSVIVLNWNARKYIERCLTALTALDYPAFQITVVDNASTDGSLNIVRDRFREARIIANHQNVGYAAGNNLAIKQINQLYVAIVNPDVFVARDWLTAQVRVMQEDETVGITGSKLYYPEEKALIQHAGGYINFPRATTGHYGLLEQDQGQWDTQREVDYVIGAAILIRRSAIAQVGSFDERYFMYFDDVDLCYRFRRAGFRTLYVPGAVGTHVESATGRKGSALYYRRFHESRWRFLLLNYDLDKILSETVPAERIWISRLGSIERRAFFKAVQSTLQALPSIRTDRCNDPTTTGMTEIQMSEIQTALTKLKDHARRQGLYSLAEFSGVLRKKFRWGGASQKKNSD